MKFPNPEEIMRHYGIDTGGFLRDQQVLSAIRYAIRETRNISLQWAAENARLKDLDSGLPRIKVLDKESILAGKTHKDLEI